MMADKPDGARGRDDKDLHDGPDTPSQGGSSGGTIARQVGSRDEDKNARGGDPEPTNVTKSDHIPPGTGPRRDPNRAARPRQHPHPSFLYIRAALTPRPTSRT